MNLAMTDFRSKSCADLEKGYVVAADHTGHAKLPSSTSEDTHVSDTELVAPPSKSLSLESGVHTKLRCEPQTKMYHLPRYEMFGKVLAISRTFLTARNRISEGQVSELVCKANLTP